MTTRELQRNGTALCLIMSLVGCTSASPEDRPHQNTIVKMGGVSHVPIAANLFWVHSISLLYGKGDCGPNTTYFSVHMNASGFKTTAVPEGATSCAAPELNQATRRYMFANGAKAYLDVNSNLVVTLTNGNTIIVSPSVTFYFPWTPPPPPGSGFACDCGMPGGIKMIPYIQGIVEGNFLIYRIGSAQETWIFGLKEDEQARLTLPAGYFLDDIGNR